MWLPAKDLDEEGAVYADFTFTIHKQKEDGKVKDFACYLYDITHRHTCDGFLVSHFDGHTMKRSWSCFLYAFLRLWHSSEALLFSSHGGEDTNVAFNLGFRLSPSNRGPDMDR